VSQAGDISATSGPVPPAVPTQFTADDSTTGIPASNNLNLFSRDTSDNNDNGIQTSADPNNSDNFYVELTNRITGTVVTTDATPTTLISFSLGAFPGTIIAQGDVTAYNVTDAAGASYTYAGAAITDGLNATEISVENLNVFEQAAMTAATITLGVSGNNAVITVTGIVGKRINWNALFTYRFIGVA